MTAAAILARIAGLRVLVAGDICLDRWCRYDPDLASPSRETGIPRIAVVETKTTAGAGGTVAANAAALGARAAVLGAAGDDGFGWELTRALGAASIDASLLLRAPGIPTFTYTKLIDARTGQENLPRVDFVHARPLPAAVDAELTRMLEEAAPGFDAILVSDQAETAQGGVVTAAMRAALGRIARRDPERVVWVDSRLRAAEFRGAIVKANRGEMEAASLAALGRVDFGALRRHVEAPLLFVTDGPAGALVVTERASQWVPARTVEHPVDICGAGDSFSAGAALGYRVTGDPVESARFGNLVASVTITKRGTGTASPAELLRQPAQPGDE
jgi:rfaE bifunctional protein kinase chain/domain